MVLVVGHVIHMLVLVIQIYLLNGIILAVDWDTDQQLIKIVIGQKFNMEMVLEIAILAVVVVLLHLILRLILLVVHQLEIIIQILLQIVLLQILAVQTLLLMVRLQALQVVQEV